MEEVVGRRMVVVVLQSRISLAIWLHGILLTWERTTYSQSIHNTFYSSMVCKNSASFNSKHLQLFPV